MNFLSFEQLTPEPDTDFIRVESLSVDSRGMTILKVEWLPRCRQGKHVARNLGMCRSCEQEWAHAQGQIMRVDGWFNGCLKVLHSEAPVLVAHGWTLGTLTAEFTYLHPPEGDDDILIPLYDAKSLPAEQARAFTLLKLPFLRDVEISEIVKMRRTVLNAYKRVAPGLPTLEAHMAYLSKV